MLKLIVSNLRERPTRTVVSVLAIGLGVALVLVCVGLAEGQLTDHADRVRKAGGDLLLQPPNASHVLAISTASMSVRLEKRIREVAGVRDVAPVYVKMDSFSQVLGVATRFSEFNPYLKFLEGRMFEGPYEVIIDTINAESNHRKVGDTIEILAHSFRVSGIYQAGAASRLMVPIETVQELDGAPDKCSVFFIRVENTREIPAVQERLENLFQGYKITPSSKLTEIWLSETPLFGHFVRALVGIAVAISFLIILLSMYSTITERTREIGILKSLGASKSFVVQLILKESLVICVLGVALGFLLNAIGLKLVHIAFPTLPVMIPTLFRVGAPIIAVVGGTIGSLYPAIKAARLDPVRALGYE